jgi:hypothetical protein
MKKSMAIFIVVIMLSGLIAGAAGLIFIQGKEVSKDVATEDSSEVQASSNKININVNSGDDYDVYAIRDEDDLRAVSEEIAYSWDSPTEGENSEEWEIETSKMGSEHWNVNSRAHTNTTSLITIQEYPTKAHYLEDITCSGMLYEDNNSDGQPNAGDTPIPRAQMHALWDDGSLFREYFTFYTQEDSDTDANASQGQWVFNFTIEETDIGPVELEILYHGEWTTNGSAFYEVNDTDYTGIDTDMDSVIDTWGIRAQRNLLAQQYLVDDDSNFGIDEEFFDFANTHPIPLPWPNATYDGGGPHDCDGDGGTDEDVAAFIARFPMNMKLMVALWHDASLTSQLSQPSVIAGETFTVSGRVRDASVPDDPMGFKTLQIRFNGQLVGQTVAVKGFDSSNPTDQFSEYSFTYSVPKNTPPGKHPVEVLMAPEFNVSNNMYYEAVNVTKYIKVLRPTEIIFDNIGEYAWVYHTKLIHINGSIIDKYFYRNYGIKEGIRLNVGPENFAKKYMFYLYWTKGSTYIQKGPYYVNNTNASFSIPLVVPGDQQLGAVNVTMELKCDNTYYLPSTNYTEYVTRATTSVDLWLDQNNNGKINEANTYITRVEYIDEYGKKHYWNTAHIKGQLIDNELSTEKHPKGVANQEILVWWGYGESWQKQYTATTDAEGKFSVDVEIEYGHVLGPVTVAARFSENPYSCYYDSSSFFDTDGDPFAVVAMTQLTITPTQMVKGEQVEIRGILYDDRNIGVNNRTINFYWLTEQEKNLYEKDRNKLGDAIGYISTDSVGRFKFTEWEVPKEQPVGLVFVVATFEGSPEWPNGPTGTKYSPTDAYSKCWSQAIQFNVSAHTIIELDKTNSVKMTRFNKFTIKGRIWEAFKGEIRRNPVRNVPVEAYIIDAKNQEFFLGREYTFSEDPATDGSFQITETVPRYVVTGYAQVRVQFNGTDYYLSSQNTSWHEIWTDVEIRVLEKPDDTDNDGKWDINQHKVSLARPLRIHVKIYEANTPVDENPVPIEYGTIWLNISAKKIVRENTTRGVTNEHGRYIFNFTKPFRDTKYGKLFIEDSNQEIKINITYGGAKFFNVETKSYDGVIHPPPPPPKKSITDLEFLGLTLLQWLVFLVIIIILVAIAVFFTARWLKRRMRIRGMKRIIKRAADQLVAGNEYTAVIFKSYQKLGAHLRKYGYLRRDSETFREFEEAVKQALPIDRISMNEFLALLEEARYSHHKIGEVQRNDAIKNLRNIEGSLERIILDESAAMKALETLEEVEYTDTEIIITGGGGGPPPGARP